MDLEAGTSPRYPSAQPGDKDMDEFYQEVSVIKVGRAAVCILLLRQLKRHSLHTGPTEQDQAQPAEAIDISRSIENHHKGSGNEDNQREDAGEQGATC